MIDWILHIWQLAPVERTWPEALCLCGVTLVGYGVIGGYIYFIFLRGPWRRRE